MQNESEIDENLILDRPIEYLNLPKQIEILLKNKNINNLRKFHRLKRKKMLKIKGVGRKTASYLMAIRKNVQNEIEGKTIKPTIPISFFPSIKNIPKQKSSMFDLSDSPYNVSLNDPIQILNIPTRVENTLSMHGISDVSEFLDCPVENIRKFRNIGEKTIKYLTKLKAELLKIPELNQHLSGDFKVEEVKNPDIDKTEEEIPKETLIDLLLERAGDERAKKIIRARYGFQNGEKVTLEEVGHWFGITRERVRQIQEKSIKKMRHPSTNGRSSIMSMVADAIQKNGLIISDEEADTIIPNIFNNNLYDGSSFLDLLCDLNWIQKNSVGDVIFYASKDDSVIVIRDLMDYVYNQIKTSKDLLGISEISDQLRIQKEVFRQCNNLDNLVFRICKIDPRIEEKVPNKFGLYSSHTSVREWSRMITEILKESGAPLHFTEISTKLNERLSVLGNNSLDVRRVHSILIENPEFSHTGVRGTYGLTEWGFRKETTPELVEECIKKAGFPLHWRQIYNYVSKFKDTKPANITAILNSQNKFISLGKGVYGLSK